MLENDIYTTLVMTKMKIENLHSTADKLRMASILKQKKTVKHSRTVISIIHGTGRALISTGNRLLKIA